MQTAIATVCLSGTLNEKLDAIAAARFKGVEIFENDLLSFDGTPAEGGTCVRARLPLAHILRAQRVVPMWAAASP